MEKPLVPIACLQKFDKPEMFNEQLLQFCNAVYSGEPIKRWIYPSIPKKGYLGITTNYRGITLATLAAKVYNLRLLNLIHPEL